MNPQTIVAIKFVLGWSANIGATRIVSGIVHNNVARVAIYDKLLVPIGSLAVGSLLGSAAQKHVHEQIDMAVEVTEKIQEEQKKRNLQSVK